MEVFYDIIVFAFEVLSLFIVLVDENEFIFIIWVNKFLCPSMEERPIQEESRKPF